MEIVIKDTKQEVRTYLNNALKCSYQTLYMVWIWGIWCHLTTGECCNKQKQHFALEVFGCVSLNKSNFCVR